MTLRFNFRTQAQVIALAAGLITGTAQASGWETDISGAHRTFNENLTNPFRPGRTEDENLLSFRTNVKVEAKNGSWTLVGEIQDSRAYGIDDTRNLNGGSVNALEPIQYYVQYDREFQSNTFNALEVKAGRFTAKLGNGRLIGRNGYRNTLFDFMGTKAKLTTTEGNSLEMFWMMGGQIRPTGADNLDDNKIRHDRHDDDLWVSGVFGETVTLIPNTRARGYLITLQEDDTPGTRESRNRELFTLGGQLLRGAKAGAWDFDIEAAFQTGTRRATADALDTSDLDVSSYFAHIALGYTLNNAPLNMAFTYDYATGDDSPDDDESNLYDPNFGPIKGDLGPTAQWTLVHRNNLSAPGLRLKYKTQSDRQLFFHWQAVWLDSATDAFGRTGVQDTSGDAGDFAGNQLHASLKTPLFIDGLTLDLGAVYFDNGDFFDDAPNATGNGDPRLIYTMITYRF
jgi:hypothetical protein